MVRNHLNLQNYILVSSDGEIFSWQGDHDSPAIPSTFWHGRPIESGKQMMQRTVTFNMKSSFHAGAGVLCWN